MTVLAASLTRALLPNEAVPTIGEVSGKGFSLVVSKVRKLRSTEALIYYFDVLDTSGDRIGLASLVCEPSIHQVKEFGHICVNLSASSSSEKLLAEVGRVLQGIAAQHGLTTVRIVVPDVHLPSVAACSLLGPSGPPMELTIESRRHLAFDYVVS